MATTNQLPQIGWDSCVILDFLDQKAGRYEYVKPIAEEAKKGKLKIVVSMLAVAEVLHLGSAPPDEQKVISDFFESPFVHREAAGLFVCEIARDIRRNHPVDGADSIHLASAVITNTPILLTTDGTGKKKKKPLLPLDGKIKLANGNPLKIMTPKDYDQMQNLVANPILAATAAPVAKALPTAAAPAQAPASGAGPTS